MILAMRSAFQFIILSAFGTLTLSGCVYRMNIQQGNYIEGRALDQLRVGMTRSQVRYLLGTPMVPEAFDDERWDYLYFLKRGRAGVPEQSHLIVYFDEDKVSKFDRSKATGTKSVLSEPVTPEAPEIKSGSAPDTPDAPASAP